MDPAKRRALVERYLGTFPAKIADLASLEAQLSETPAAAPELAELRAQIRDAAHKLAGSGGAYGFPAITEKARAVQDGRDTSLGPALAALIQCLEEIRAREGVG